MYHESTRCKSIFLYSNKHDKIENNCVSLENKVEIAVKMRWQQNSYNRPLSKYRK